MERMVIGFPRWTQDAAWSGGSWVSAYPAANLGTLPLSRVARSTNLATTSTQFTATLSAPRMLRCFALVRHNITLDGLVRIRTWSDAAATVLTYDSGWIDVWPSTYLPGDLEWEDDNWWVGKYTAVDLQGSNPTRPFWLDGLKEARVIRVEIDDAANPAGYVQIGLFEIAQGWQVSINPVPGYSEGFRFRTEVSDALGGVRHFDRRDKPRVAVGEIADLPRNEALGRGYEFLRQYDIDIPFLWFPFPDEAQHWLRTAFLARNVDPGRIVSALLYRARFTFSVEEVL
jgi:hypothetical protein